ncbi:hypothetical protein E1B28_005910, partial [Marasmius oreades]
MLNVRLSKIVRLQIKVVHNLSAEISRFQKIRWHQLGSREDEPRCLVVRDSALHSTQREQPFYDPFHSQLLTIWKKTSP